MSHGPALWRAYFFEVDAFVLSRSRSASAEFAVSLQARSSMPDQKIYCNRATDVDSAYKDFEINCSLDLRKSFTPPLTRSCRGSDTGRSSPPFRSLRYMQPNMREKGSFFAPVINFVAYCRSVPRGDRTACMMR
jgi:hypothetical protein